MLDELTGSMGKGGGGHTPTEADDTLESRQTVRLLLAYHDGKVDQSKPPTVDDIYINRTPASNFTGFSFDWRPGTQDQTAIPGFSETESPVAGFAAANITFNTFYTRAIDYAASAVRITLSLASLRKVLDNGDLVGYQVWLNIYTKSTVSGAYTFYYQTRKKGKASSQYAWDIRIPRPVGAVPGQQWQIKITRVTEDDPNVKKNSATSIIAITEIYERNPALTYPGTALLALTLKNAEQFGGSVPEITLRLYGGVVYLPTNYNPATRVYNESTPWNGAFKIYEEYTDNPVWHLYSILLNRVPGIDANDLDLAAFYSCAKYADMLVDNGRGGLEPRYTMHQQWTQRENSPTFLMYLLTIFSGNFCYNEFGQLSLSWDRPGQPVSKIVSNANVIDGRFSYLSNDIEERFSLVNVTYNNPDALGDTSTVTVDDAALLDRYGLQTNDIALAGCYSEAQAYRKARWALASSSLYTQFVTFSVYLYGLAFQLGEVIKIQDAENSGYSHQGRILSAAVVNSSVVMVLDRSITLANASYNITFIGSDGSSVLTKTITQVNGSFSTVSYNGAQLPLEESIFILESTAQPAMLAKVVSIKKDSDFYNITCIEHSDDKYLYIDGSISLPDPEPNWLNFENLVVSAPVNITFTENFNADGINSGSKLIIQWQWNLSGAENVKPFYKLLWRRDSQSWTTIDRITIAEYDIINPVPGQYEVVVYAINPVSGLVSSPSDTAIYDYRVASASSTLSPVLVAVVQGTNGTVFSTPDLNLFIQHNSANDDKPDKLRDYLVEVWSADGQTKIYTVIVDLDTGKNGLFRLPLATNTAIFGTPTRQFVVKIYSRDLTGRLSAAKAVSVNNPVPGVCSFSMVSGVGVTYVRITPPADPDLTGFKIWRGDATGFTANATTEIYDGPDTYVSIAGTPGQTYYYRIAAYDTFGKTGINQSGEQSATMLSFDVDTWTFAGLVFKPNDPATNKVSWTAGTAHKTSGATTTDYSIAAGNITWTSGILYIYYHAGDTTLSSTTTLGTAVAGSGRILATYEGGTALIVGNGSAFISGDKLLAGSVGAQQLVADSAVITSSAQIAGLIVNEGHIENGAITNAKIGNSIQSINYNATNHLGWKIDKFGNITSYGSVNLFDSSGNPVLLTGANAGLYWSAINGRPFSVFDLGYIGDNNATYGADSSNLTVGTGGNLIPNSDFNAGVGAWTGSPTLDLAGAAFTPSGGHSIGRYRVGYPATEDLCSYKISVIGGRNYCVAADFATHRCVGHLYINYYTGADTIISQGHWVRAWTYDNGGINLSGWERIGGITAAPMNAAYCLVFVGGGVALAEGPYWASTRPMLSEATPGQTELPVYSPGGVRGAFSEVDTLHAGNIGVYMASAAIGTLQVGGNAITADESVITGSMGVGIPAAANLAVGSEYTITAIAPVIVDLATNRIVTLSFDVYNWDASPGKAIINIYKGGFLAAKFFIPIDTRVIDHGGTYSYSIGSHTFSYPVPFSAFESAIITAKVYLQNGTGTSERWTNNPDTTTPFVIAGCMLAVSTGKR